jgi:ATP-dependent protease ClpP protease subunit
MKISKEERLDILAGLYAGNNIVTLDGDVNTLNINRVITDIHKINLDKENTCPYIYLLISSGGGYMCYACALKYLMKISDKPIITVNISHCYSAAFSIFIHGKYRIGVKGSRFLDHSGKIYTTTNNKRYLENMIEAGKYSHEHLNEDIKTIAPTYYNIRDELYKKYKGEITLCTGYDDLIHLDIVDEVI